MTKVGPKAAVPPDDIKEKLLEFEILKSNVSIKSKSDSVWISIASALGNLVKPVTLYFFVYQDRYNSLTNYKKEKGIEEFVQDSENLAIDHDVESVSDNCVSPSAKKRKYYGKKLKIYRLKL